MPRLEFPFRSSWRTLNIAMIVMAGMLVTLNISTESYVLVAIWVFVGIMSVLQLRAVSSGPAARIEDGSLFLFRGPVREPQQVRLDDIDSVNRKGKRLDIVLTGGKTVRFSMAWLAEEDHDRLVEALKPEASNQL